jgi:hypothetical protein
MTCIRLRCLQRFGIGYDGAVEWLPFLESQCAATKRDQVIWIDGTKRFPRLPQVGTMTMARNPNPGYSNEYANDEQMMLSFAPLSCIQPDK